ncbi:MAG: GTPase Era [Gammaproteobacteria bacterium]|nr:GTPase Era [Gammaproteobacteria bacterium]MDE2252124.1 GTPase Era [Gammaproteobacteria bacterium]
MSAFRSGFVALVGRPNVGKSTLLNAMLGQKVSIVTPRPQTTRHRVLGISESDAGQIAFIDTPGMHQGPKRALNRAMNRAAGAALGDADLAVFIAEAMKWTDEDELALGRILQAQRPVIAVINKVDRVHPRERLLPYIARLAARTPFVSIVPLSALRADNLEALRSAILAALPEGERLYPAGQVTDRGERFRIAELIREKLTLELVEELPYGIAVEVEGYTEAGDGRVEVQAVIWVDREGQKPIVIGAGGERLKRIGRAARLELNRLFGRRYHLTLWVKVRENWADDARALRQLEVE